MESSTLLENQEPLQETKTKMTNETETKRGVGRPSAFPENVTTKLAGFNLPVESLAKLKAAAADRKIPQNLLLNRAIESYLRRASAKS